MKEICLNGDWNLVATLNHNIAFGVGDIVAPFHKVVA